MADSLNQMAQHPPFAIHAVIDLLETGTKHKDLSLNNTMNMLRTIGGLSRSEQNKEAGFNLLMRLIRQSDNTYVRLMAADTIHRYYPDAAKSHQDEIKTILQSTWNPKSTK